jgi:tungstate transport system substrate-binding protein
VTVALAAALPAPASPAAAQTRDIILATTTSVRDAGLLDSLLPGFERVAGYAVKVIAVGSGQAMELGRRGEADLLILHEPAGEERFVAEGFGVDRRALMHNEFVLVGPVEDPAAVRAVDVITAFQRIAAARAPFVSRGDQSGTHVKERLLWARAGLTPAGRWYRESGQGMGATLVIASEFAAYALTDVATFLAHRLPPALEILVEGDSILRNPYHVIRANPARFARVNADGAAALAAYLLSPETQRMIGEFRREELGRAIFVPDGNDGKDGNDGR